MNIWIFHFSWYRQAQIKGYIVLYDCMTLCLIGSNESSSNDCCNSKGLTEAKNLLVLFPNLRVKN